MCILFVSLISVTLSGLLGPQFNLSTNFTSHFWEVVDDLEGPGGAALRGKIYFGMEMDYIFLIDRNFRTHDQERCYEKLHRIMIDNLTCPRSANKIKPYLDILEFRHNMSKDEIFVQSYYQRNCTWLGGRSARMCKQGEIYVQYETFVKLLDDCHLEKMEPARRGNASLSKM